LEKGKEKEYKPKEECEGEKLFGSETGERKMQKIQNEAAKRIME